MAAPGPPVAKLQCAASLAGARPAGFTSVPGRAAVAFGAVDPSPGSWAPVYPWSDGQGLPRPGYLGRRLAAASRLGKARAQRGAWGGGWRRLRVSLCPCPARANLPPPWRQYFLAGNPFPAGKFTCFSLYKRGVFCYNETQRFRTVCPGCRSLRRRTWWTAMSAPRPSWPPQYRSPRAKKNGGKTHDQERDHRRLCPSRGRHRFP